MSAVGTRSRTEVDPGAALLRALAADAPPGSALELVAMTSAAWASATFTGARHAIRLRAVDGAALAAWLAGLPEAPFVLRGHLLADIAVTSVARDGGEAEIELEALTLEDR